jgi:hypothetical protein
MMFGDAGWCIVPKSQAIAQWAKRRVGRQLAQIAKPKMRETWLQCEGTWFVGVDVLDNDSRMARLPGVALPATLAQICRSLSSRAGVCHLSWLSQAA